MSDARFWIALNRIPTRLGATRFRQLLSYFGDLSAAWTASAASLRGAGLPKKTIDAILYFRQRIDPQAELARVQSLGIQVLTWEDTAYPENLSEIGNAPPVLYVRGEVVAADALSLAIVGTRAPSAYGREVTRWLASAMARAGVTVVSGLALGIDGIAHNASLDTGGRTVAVLGSGLDHIYPARHARLAERIESQGAIITDYALDTKPQARNFPPRNRIISGLSLGTLIVEAGERSGALITLRFALEQGRETFAVPGSILSGKSAGTNAAIRRGEAKLVDSVDGVLEELNLSMVMQQHEIRGTVPADSPTEEALMSALSTEPAHIDEIVRASGLPTATVSSTLCLMELKGMVRRADSMSYVLAR